MWVARIVVLMMVMIVHLELLGAWAGWGLCLNSHTNNLGLAIVLSNATAYNLLVGLLVLLLLLFQVLALSLLIWIGTGLVIAMMML